MFRFSVHPSFRSTSRSVITRSEASGSSSAYGIRMPTRRTWSDCCARTVSGHPIAVLPKSLMNSRRLMASPAPRTTSGMKRKYHILDRELCRSLHLSRQPSCPLWVKSRHDGPKPRCPLFSQKRRLAKRSARSRSAATRDNSRSNCNTGGTTDTLCLITDFQMPGRNDQAAP
jgi:hypothetical protein